MTDAIHPAPTEFTAQEIDLDNVLQFFHYAHLPPSLQTVSKPFCELARYLVDNTPRCQQRTLALNNLLTAKDCAVRTLVPRRAS